MLLATTKRGWGRAEQGLHILGVLALALVMAMAAKQATAADDGAMWQTVSHRTLDKMRGGFSLGNGLQVSFGITRAVYVNGALITQTTLTLGDLSRVTSMEAARMQGHISELNLVQNGPGNSILADLSNLRDGVIIQNTLNNQQINAQTVINASTNGLSMVRTMNTQAAIEDAINRAVGPR